MKRCPSCKQLLPVTSFNRRKRSANGRQSYCRSCNSASSRKYHYANKADHNRQIHLRSRKIAGEMKRLLYEYLLEHPCVDCGEADPVVLEFDHLRDKIANVSALAASGSGWPEILAEIAKCEVVCASCHRRRTCKTARSFRYVVSRRLPVLPPVTASLTPAAVEAPAGVGQQLTLPLALR
jgi:hypothetical protein